MFNYKPMSDDSRISMFRKFRDLVRSNPEKYRMQYHRFRIEGFAFSLQAYEQRYSYQCSLTFSNRHPQELLTHGMSFSFHSKDTPPVWHIVEHSDLWIPPDYNNAECFILRNT